MEYREQEEKIPYRPRFGYLHEPTEEEDLYDILQKDGTVRTVRVRKGVTMPRPEGDPLRLLIFALILIVTLIVCVLFAARMENSYHARHLGQPGVTAARIP
ncbi:MAG: hypothetical protein IJQ12_09055 [Lachnospiraceae bacterium]|nr:hypothetical protein [Lachnospiraceae bacterium]